MHFKALPVDVDDIETIYMHPKSQIAARLHKKNYYLRNRLILEVFLIQHKSTKTGE